MHGNAGITASRDKGHTRKATHSIFRDGERRLQSDAIGDVDTARMDG